MKKIIMCADDFAFHEPASRGIVELARAGRLSATSAMVLSPRWPIDVAWLRELRGRIDVGLHLDWTSEFALQARHGRSLGRLMFNAALGALNSDSARVVIERQLDAFEAQWKAPPDHVDGHQHVHQFDGIRQALVETLARRYADHKPYLRVSRVPALQADFKSNVISLLGASALEKIAKSEGFISASGLSGVYNFSQAPRSYAKRMDHWLTTSPSGSILMCHPAMQVDTNDAIGAARVWEYDFLGSVQFADALARADVVVMRGKAT